MRRDAFDEVIEYYDSLNEKNTQDALKTVCKCENCQCQEKRDKGIAEEKIVCPCQKSQ